jgi:hypothetical protein
VSDDQFQEFFKRFPELMHNTDCVMHAGLMAGAYASLAGGVHARAILADVFAGLNTRQFSIAGAEAVTKRMEREALFHLL